MFENTDGIIFDLDGTLWDATEPISKVWNTVIHSYSNINKTITVADLKSVMGKTLEEIGDIFFPKQPLSLRREIIEKCCRDQCPILEKTGGTLYAKVPETIKELSKKYKLFIVSNCQEGYIPAFLKAHNLKSYFTDFECPGTSGLSKGENNKLIIQRNNLKSAIYVGDTLGDFNSAKEAEIPFIFASYGFGYVENPAAKIKTFDELLKL